MERADFDQWNAREVARLLQLVETERRYHRELAEILPVPVALFSAKDSLLWANRAFRTRSGFRSKELSGKRLSEALEGFDAAREVLSVPLARWDDPDEIETLVVVTEPPIGEERSAEAEERERQLKSAARFDAIYSFAGRVAHDLNNPLMIISGYAEELLASTKATDPARKEISEIAAAAERISVVSAQLVDFARKHAKPAGRVNVAEALKLPKGSALVWTVADEAQLIAVVRTVAAGALDAKKISISCGYESVDSVRYARITIRHDGKERDRGQQASMFDPVLLKTPAEGMTFSEAYGVIREWGGDIGLKPGAFEIYLPAADESAAASTPAPKLAAGDTVLVVEDEAGIRKLIVKILRRESYQVIEAASAEEALTLAARQSGIRMLITDVKLPGVTGPALARKLHGERPGLKVLYISGYTDDETARLGAYPPGARFLPKPFTLSALLRTVKETWED